MGPVISRDKVLSTATHWLGNPQLDTIILFSEQLSPQTPATHTHTNTHTWTHNNTHGSVRVCAHTHIWPGLHALLERVSCLTRCLLDNLGAITQCSASQRVCVFTGMCVSVCLPICGLEMLSVGFFAILSPFFGEVTLPLQYLFTSYPLPFHRPIIRPLALIFLHTFFFTYCTSSISKLLPPHPYFFWKLPQNLCLSSPASSPRPPP